MKLSNKTYILIIIFSALCLYFPFLGRVHLFDWDEINFAESAREMLLTGNYSRVQINFEPFWEKPPLFFWLQTLSMRLFGINEFAARFPNAVLGLVTLLTFYFIGKRLYSERFGFIWAICYLGSFLPHLYFKSGIIDPTFNYFIFLSVYFIANSTSTVDKKEATKYAVFAGIAIGFAILTKGPVGFLILCLTCGIYWMLSKFKSITTIKNILVFGLCALAIAFLWFGIETLKNGTWFLKEFITYQIRLFSTPDAGHGQPFYYHFVVVALGCFPISAFAVYSLSHKLEDNNIQFIKWMKILFWVVMILFSIVTTKIVHYSSMAYFPLSFLAAYYLNQLLDKKLVLQKYMYAIMLTFGTLFSLILAAFPILAYNKEKLYPFIKDEFALACLKTTVEWNGTEFLIGLIYLSIIYIAFWQIKKQQIFRGLILLFYSSALCMLVYTAVVVPKVEGYSQLPAIEFYEKLSGQDVYVTPVGFKSYAQYFYFKQPVVTNLQANDKTWLLTGSIDKPAYFVAKINKIDDVKDNPEIKLVEQKGGFALYRRESK